MDFNNFVSFLKEHITPAALIAAIVINGIIKFVKYIFIVLIKYSNKKLKSYSNSNIKYLIRHYENRINELRELKNLDVNRILKISDEILRSSISIVIVLTLLYLIKDYFGNLIFFCFFGATFTRITFDVYIIISSYRIVRMKKSYDTSKLKFEKKIERNIKLLKNLNRNYNDSSTSPSPENPS